MLARTFNIFPKHDRHTMRFSALVVALAAFATTETLASALPLDPTSLEARSCEFQIPSAANTG